MSLFLSKDIQVNFAEGVCAGPKAEFAAQQLLRHEIWCPTQESFT